MEEKYRHLQKDLKYVLIETVIIFFLFFLLLIINAFAAIQDAQIHFLINGFLTGLLLMIFLFSLGGLKFETVVKKTVLNYQLNALIWRVIAVLVFFLNAMVENPGFPDFLLLIVLGVASIAFDYLALKEFKSLDIKTVQALVLKYDQALKDSEKAQYKAHTTLLKKTAFLAVIYFFVIGSFDYTRYFHLIFMLVTLFLLLYQYIRIFTETPAIKRYIFSSCLITLLALITQFFTYHTCDITYYIVHFALLWVGFSPLFMLYVYFQTKLGNHENLGLIKNTAKP